MKKIFWNKQSVPVELHGLLNLLKEQLPLEEGATSDVVFRRTDDGHLELTRKNGRIEIAYPSIAGAARGVALAVSGMKKCSEELYFDHAGLMFDCSRNGVIAVAAFKKYLLLMAMAGFDRMYIYAEDVYEVKNEPYFGYMRGRYTVVEIRELDEYAAGLGIQISGCIQTLAHMHQFCKWPAAAHYDDIGGALLMDDPDTASLIGRMLDFWSQALPGRPIHVGMDEASFAGHGRYYERHGDVDRFALFARHIGVVSSLCHERGLTPMIWSDVYFRLLNADGSYHGSDNAEKLSGIIEPDIELVCWDYYHDRTEWYADRLNLHKKMSRRTHMASGIWTWRRLWYDHKLTMATATAAVAGCRASGVKEIFFTLWADNGAYCEFNSCFAGVFEVADLIYGSADAARLFRLATGDDLASYLTASEMEYYPDTVADGKSVSAACVLWDDPLLGIAWHEYPAQFPEIWGKVLANYQRIKRSLIGKSKSGGHFADFEHLQNLLQVLMAKVKLRFAMEQAYVTRDKRKMRHIIFTEIPGICADLKKLQMTFRNQWMLRNKPQGFEVIQIRLAGLSARYQECALRLTEILDSPEGVIPELEEKITACGHSPTDYARLATASYGI